MFDSIIFLLVVFALIIISVEFFYVGEIIIEDISDYIDIGIMEETEFISVVELENEDGERVRNIICLINDIRCLVFNVIGCLRFV